MGALISQAEPISPDVAVSVATLTVGIVFAYAVVSKLSDIPALIGGIREYPVVPTYLVPLTAFFLIGLEGVTAAAHLGAIALPVVVPATVTLLCVFLFVTFVLLLRGDERACLCFGANRSDPVDVASLFRILALLAAELTVGTFLFSREDPASAASSIAAGMTLDRFSLAALIVVLGGWFLAATKLFHAWGDTWRSDDQSVAEVAIRGWMGHILWRSAPAG